MKFNIGLDLNRSHGEMKHNAFPKAKNVLLNDFGDTLITESGMSNVLTSTYTFSKGAIVNNVGTTIGTSSVVFTLTDCVICGYINISPKVLLFMYDTVKKIAFILRIEPTTGVYDIIVQNIAGTYTTYSFNKTLSNLNIDSSIIKGTFCYNYLNQLIIAYNDVNNYIITNNSSSDKFIPNYWISNLDETYVNENAKINTYYIDGSTHNGQSFTLNTYSSGNLEPGTYFIAFVLIDNNGNESELSAFTKIPILPYYPYFDSFGNITVRFDTLNYGATILCTASVTSYNYKLIIGYKSSNDITILYYKTPLLNGNYIINNLLTLETTNISDYINNTVIQNVGAIEQYDNKLLLGGVILLDENYSYLDSTTNKTIGIELQKISNNIYFTYTNVTEPDISVRGSNVIDKFASDEVYALYIEYISTKGTSLGCYHIPGRPSIAAELADGNGLYMTGIYIKGNVTPSSCTCAGNSVVGAFVNKTEYYPSTFPGTGLSISSSALVVGTGNSNVLAGARVRHHKMPGGSTLLDLIARNIIIPTTLKSIVYSYRIYYAKRDNVNNLLLDSGVIDSQTGANSNRLDYYLSFESLYNKVPLNCGALRKIATIDDTYQFASQGTVSQLLYISNWITNPVIAFNTLDFVEENVQQVDTNIQVIPQSYLYDWLMPTIITTLSATFGIGGYNVYSTNITNNCYNNYIDQNLILSNFTITTADTYITLSGDASSTYENYGINNGTNDNNVAHRKIYYALLASKYNHNYRYKLYNLEITTPEKQKLYPYDNTTSITTLLQQYNNPINNSVGIFYKTCFNATNNLNQPLVFDLRKSFVSNLPNRIYRSKVNSSESTVIGWRNVTGLDYYDLPRNKDKIISIEIDTKRMYVQQKYGLFVTDIKDTLTTDINALPLDLFEYIPIEINKNNPIRSYNPFTLKLTPIGVIAISDDSRIYVINQGSIEELTMLGTENYLTPKYDISTSYEFVHIGVDITNKRILFNSPNKTTSLSYNYMNKCFVAEHDYNPKFAININNNIYFVSIPSATLGLYKFDSSSLKYLGGSVDRNSKVDIIFNSYPEVTKLLQSIDWITHSIKTDGSEDEFDTFYYLMVYNNTQCSGLVDLRTIINSDNSKFDWFDSRRSLKIYDSFHYNSIYDMVSYNRQPFLDSNLEPISSQFPTKMWYEMSNFISNYFVIRFTYNGANKLIINSITTELIKTAR